MIDSIIHITTLWIELSKPSYTYHPSSYSWIMLLIRLYLQIINLPLMLRHYSLVLLFLLPLLNLPLELHIISLLYLLRMSFFLHLQLFLSRYFILHIISIDFISLLRDCRLYIPLLHLLIKRKCIRNIIFLLLLFDLKLSLRVLPLLYFDIIKIICLISLCFVLIILLHKLVVQLSSLLIRRLILTQLDKILLP